MLTSKCWLACCGHEEILKMIFLVTKIPWEQPQSNGCTSFYCVLWNICFWSEQNYTSLLAYWWVYSNFAQIKWSFSIPFYVIVSCSTHWSLRHNYAAVSCNCLEGTDATATARDRGFNEASHRSSAKSLFPPVKAVPIALAVRTDRSALWNFVSLVVEFPGGVSLGNLSNSLRH